MNSALDKVLAVDARKLDGLKTAAGRDPAGQAREAAKQFEAVFTNLLMKSMREAMPKSELSGGSSSMSMFEGMLDQQRAQAFAGRGLGLAPVIEKQLLKHIAAASPETVEKMKRLAPEGLPLSKEQKAIALAKPQAAIALPAASKTAVASATATPESFVDKVKDFAASAAKKIGVPTSFVLGQAALESGWGKKEIGASQGVQSHNLFGIKAGAGWKGATVEIPTTEYVNGVATKVMAKFRAYANYAEAFSDYAKLITGSKRYSEAAGAGDDVTAFAQGLQKGGYATDPQYADKLARVIDRASRAA